MKSARVDWQSGDAEVRYDARSTRPEKIVTAFNEQQERYRAELARSRTK